MERQKNWHFQTSESECNPSKPYARSALESPHFDLERTMNIGTSAMNSGHHNGHAAVLTSWKDIARYMGKGVRTVQRWEQDFGLPVRRPQGSNKKAVLARPADLDAWVAMRCTSRAEVSAATAADHHHTRSVSLAVLSSLNSKMETARLLRDNHQALMGEISAAIIALRKQVQSLQAGRGDSL